MKVFCDSYKFKDLIKDAKCYNNPENPSCIDLILMNNPNSFQNSGVIETGLSDFYKMMVTVMKKTSYITGTIENFQAINSGKILFPVYQLKVLELTVMA